MRTKAAASLFLACAACGGTKDATRGGTSGTGTVDAVSTPAWFASPRKSPSALVFVGDSAGSADEGAARDLAISKALANLTVYCGASIKSDSVSLEKEVNGKFEYNVSVNVDVAGDEITVREARVTKTEVLRATDGSYAAFAEMEWPKAQYEAVLAMQRQRAQRALAMYLGAEAAEKEQDGPRARQALKEAKAILGPMRSSVPLDHASYKNTSLLYDAMKAMDERLAAAEQEKRSVYAVAVECTRDGRPHRCSASRPGSLRAALSKVGRKVSADAIPDPVATAILSSDNPTLDRGIRSAGYVLAVRYTGELMAVENDITFVRCGARGVVFDTASGRIVDVHEVPPVKEGFPNLGGGVDKGFVGAAEKGWNSAEKKLLAWVEAQAAKGK